MLVYLTLMPLEGLIPACSPLLFIFPYCLTHLLNLSTVSFLTNKKPKTFLKHKTTDEKCNSYIIFECQNLIASNFQDHHFLLLKDVKHIIKSTFQQVYQLLNGLHSVTHNSGWASLDTLPVHDIKLLIWHKTHYKHNWKDQCKPEETSSNSIRNKDDREFS